MSVPCADTPAWLFLTFGNTHNTLRAERCLRSAGLPFAVVSKPPAIRGPCGLAIRLAADLEQAALASLKQGRIPPRQMHYSTAET